MAARGWRPGRNVIGASIRRLRRLLRSVARHILFPVVEGAWTGLFAVAGHLVRPTARKLVVSGHDRVLVLAPHPDDETIGCGGTIGLHLAGGDDVCVLVVTDGGGSRAHGLSGEKISSIRHSEAECAISRLHSYQYQIELVQMRLPESEWHEEQLIAELNVAISTFRPTIVYATSCVDFHPEHVRVGQALARTIARHGSTTIRSIRVYELQVPLTPLLANLRSNISAHSDRKRAALDAYTTQRGSFGWIPRASRYRRVLYRSKHEIELFCELSPAGYIEVMTNTAPNPGAFRGIRPRPLTDGAAWLVGIRSRHRVKCAGTN